MIGQVYLSLVVMCFQAEGTAKRRAVMLKRQRKRKNKAARKEQQGVEAALAEEQAPSEQA